MTIQEDMGGTEEWITENHTSEKLFTAVDMCLYKGIEVLLRYSSIYNEFIAASLQMSTRKQIFVITQNEMEKLTFEFLLSNSVDYKLSIIRKMRLNRDLLSIPVQIVSDSVDDYINAFKNNSIETLYIAKKLKFSLDSDITAYIIQVRAEYKRYLMMREAIVQKYYKLIIQQVNKSNSYSIDPEDMVVEYFNAVLRAFSKFDISSGTFTNYVLNWFKSAKAFSQENDELGIAYTIPSSIRTKIARGESDIINYSAELDKSLKGEQDSDSIDINAIKQIISFYDKTGVYRMANDLEFNPKEYLLSRIGVNERKSERRLHYV